MNLSLLAVQEFGFTISAFTALLWPGGGGSCDEAILSTKERRTYIKYVNPNPHFFGVEIG